jgi:hypothetical protein
VNRSLRTRDLEARPQRGVADPFRREHIGVTANG